MQPRILALLLTVTLCAGSVVPPRVFVARTGLPGTPRRSVVPFPEPAVVPESDDALSGRTTPLANDLYVEHIQRPIAGQSLFDENIQSASVDVFIVRYRGNVSEGDSWSRRGHIVHSSRTDCAMSLIATAIAHIRQLPRNMRTWLQCLRRDFATVYDCGVFACVFTTIFVSGALLLVAGVMDAAKCHDCGLVLSGAQSGVLMITFGAIMIVLSLFLLSLARPIDDETACALMAQMRIEDFIAHIFVPMQQTSPCELCIRTACTRLGVSLPCGHHGHKVCLLEQLRLSKSLSCPICRARILVIF